MNPSNAAYLAQRIDVQQSLAEYRINQYLRQGKYQFIVTAPFERSVSVVPLNPPVGFQFLPDQDPAAYNWNSFVIVPDEGQYAFLVRLDQPIDGVQLVVQFIYQGSSGQAPVGGQPTPAPPAPPTPPPPLDPDAANQQRYREMGYEIAGDGSVIFYHVTVRRNRRSNERQVCAVRYNAWSNDVHDPVRTIQRLTRGTSNDRDWEWFRRGPFPTASAVEDLASSFASQFFGDPTRYGLFKVGGVTRMPYFA